MRRQNACKHVFPVVALFLALAATALADGTSGMEKGPDATTDATTIWKWLVSGEQKSEAIRFYTKHADALLPPLVFIGPGDGVEFVQLKENESAKDVNEKDWHNAGEFVSQNAGRTSRYKLPKKWRGESFKLDFCFRPVKPSYARAICRTNVAVRIYPFVDEPVEVSIPAMPKPDAEKAKRRWREWKDGMDKLRAELGEVLEEKDPAIRAAAVEFYNATDLLHPKVEILAGEGVATNGFYVRQKGVEGKAWLVSPDKPGTIGRVGNVEFGSTTNEVLFSVYRQCESPSACQECSEPKVFCVDNILWNEDVHKAQLSSTNLPPFLPNPRVRIPDKYFRANPIRIEVREPSGKTKAYEGDELEKVLEAKSVEVPPHARGTVSIVFKFDRYRDASLALLKPLARGKTHSFDDVGELAEKIVDTQIVFRLDPPPLEGDDGATKIWVKTDDGKGADHVIFHSTRPHDCKVTFHQFEGVVEYCVFDGDDQGPILQYPYKHGKDNVIKVRPAAQPVPPPDGGKVEELLRRIARDARFVKDAEESPVKKDPDSYRRQKEWLDGKWKTDQNNGETAKALVAHLRNPGDCGEDACREISGKLREKCGKTRSAWTDDQIFKEITEWCLEHPNKTFHGNAK